VWVRWGASNESDVMGEAVCTVGVQEHDVVTEGTVPQVIERATDDAGLSGTE